MTSLAYTTPSPKTQRRTLHLVYMFHCPKGMLGLGGKTSKNKLKDTDFNFPMKNVTIFSIFRTHEGHFYP